MAGTMRLQEVEDIIEALEVEDKQNGRISWHCYIGIIVLIHQKVPCVDNQTKW